MLKKALKRVDHRSKWTEEKKGELLRLVEDEAYRNDAVGERLSLHPCGAGKGCSSQLRCGQQAVSGEVLSGGGLRQDAWGLQH